MLSVNYCCCCISLRTGTLILLGLTSLYNLGRIVNALTNTNETINNYKGVILAVYLFFACIPLLGIIGICMETPMPKLLIPYMCILCIFILYQIICIIAIIVGGSFKSLVDLERDVSPEKFDSRTAVMGTNYVFQTLIVFYFFICVLSYYNELVEEME